MARLQTAKTRDVRVRVPAPLFKKYKELADDNGLPVASLARLALIDYAKRHSNPSKDSPIEVVMGS